MVRIQMRNNIMSFDSQATCLTQLEPGLDKTLILGSRTETLTG